MTADLETAVRRVLAEQAGAAPDGAFLLAGVHARRRNRATRQRLAVLSVAALTLAVGSGAGIAGLRLSERPENPANGEAAGGLVAVPANWLPAFPLTPEWLPPGLGPPRTGYISHQQVRTVSYVDPGDPARPPDAARAVHIGVARTRLFPVQRGVRRSITINGRSVTAYSGPIAVDRGHPRGMGVEVAWERRPGQWVDVICESTLGTVDNVRRIAESLRDVPLQPTPDFTVTALPKGLTSLGGYGGGQLLLLPDGQRDQNQVPEARTVSVMLQKNLERRLIPRPGTAPPGQRAVTVGGRPAWLTTGGPVADLSIAVTGDLVLGVRAPATIPQPVLLRFAAGVLVRPGAVAFDAGA